MQRRTVSWAAAVALVAVACLGTGSTAASVRHPARACEQERGFGAWLYYTQAQTFTALGTDARAVDVRLLFLRSYAGNLNVRLVWHPSQQSDGTLVGGQVVQEGSVAVAGAKGDLRWVSARLSPPATPSLPKPSGIWALYVDFPVDPSHDSGPIAWAGCKWAPDTGSAYEAMTPDVADRGALGLGLAPIAPAVARQPLTAAPHPYITTFQYRVWTE